MLNLKRIQEKILTARPTKEVILEDLGCTFVFQPILNEQESLIMEKTKDVDGAEYQRTFKRYALAASIAELREKTDEDAEKVINLRNLEILHDDETNEDLSKINYMYKYFSRFPENLISVFFEVYLQLDREYEAHLGKKVKIFPLPISEIPEANKELRAEILDDLNGDEVENPPVLENN